MANDAGEKTEAPTPRRRQEARQRGQVARSTDLSAALLLLGGLWGLRVLGPRTFGVLHDAMRAQLTFEGNAAAARIDLSAIANFVGMTVLSSVGLILGGLMLLGTGANLLQVGFLTTTEPLTPNLNKINPLSGVSRLLSMRTLVQLLMNLLKLTLVTWVAYAAIKSWMPQVVLAMEVDGWQQLGLICSILYDIGLRLAVVLLLIGLTDYAWQRWRHEHDLRMTKEEVKEELRRMEGDPLIRQRRRKMQFAALMQQIRKNVPKADVVVTNPTEFAVAIQYDAETMRAPKVVAKGQDYLAMKIREIAVAHGVPIVERKALARTLFKTVEIGEEVPERLYQAIAEVLAYVYQLSGGKRRVTAA